jgi:effector-binding domain-containing protein
MCATVTGPTPPAAAGRPEEREPAVSHVPHVQQRDAQPYAGIRMQVTMGSFRAAVDDGFPELFSWLQRQSVAPAGPPFIRYLVTGMADQLKIELAVPAGPKVAGGGRIRPGVLPAGRYVVLRHVGPYDGLAASNAALQQWARERGIPLASLDTAEGTVWRARAEHYLTNPAAEPDPARWEVDVAYLASQA